jgi:mannose-1-phosphate guanylyltransferase/mannose-6-phosphate isomerase
VTLIPFILAGGQGTRLWPASRAGSPKQVLALTGEQPLIRQTCRRIAPLAGQAAIHVVTDARNRKGIEEAAPDLAPENIWTEPEGRNTGPSVSWALHEAAPEHGHAVAAFFPSDHLFADAAALREAVEAGAEVARRGRIALLGVRPTRPETGYGYIEGEAAGSSGAREVRRFLEKPDAAAAEALCRREDVFWNSGIFIMQVARGLEIIREVSPALSDFLDELPEAGTARREGMPGWDSLAAAFARVQALPFDVAVLERTGHCSVVPLDAGWSDLGSWQAVWEAGTPDPAGNVITTAGLAIDSEGCLMAGDGRTIAALGVKDLVIVAWGDAVLVCPRDRAQDVRTIVEKLS